MVQALQVQTDNGDGTATAVHMAVRATVTAVSCLAIQCLHGLDID